MGAIVTQDIWDVCDRKVSLGGFEECAFRGLMTLTGSNATEVCVSSTSTATISRLDIGINGIIAMYSLLEGSWVSLRLKEPLKAACEWWRAPIRTSMLGLCDVNVTAVDFTSPPAVTASPGETSLNLSLSHLDDIGLVSGAQREECLAFTQIEYISVSWELLTNIRPSSAPSGALRQLSLNILPILIASSLLVETSLV